jgi:ABC-2 type transport system ATP-binding protein
MFALPGAGDAAGLRPRGESIMVSIETSNLHKRYGDHSALDRLTLRIDAGEVYGFLGPNGAGKTTTLRLLMGILVPTSGSAKIRGLDCMQERVAVKRVVGYVPDMPTFYDYLKGWELLRFVGQLHGLAGKALGDRVEQLLSELGIADAAGEYVSNYSLGMKKRMGLALALIHDPEVLILDEPTTGLDPLGIRDVHRLITHHAERGRTVLLSTHLLDMADRLCHRVGILNRGRLIAEGTPQALRERLSRGDADPTLEQVFFAVTDPSQAGGA